MCPTVGRIFYVHMSITGPFVSPSDGREQQGKSGLMGAYALLSEEGGAGMVVRCVFAEENELEELILRSLRFFIERHLNSAKI